MRNTHDIYWRKEQSGTPNEPISPTAQATASPKGQKSMLRKGAMVGLGALALRKAFSTVRQEIAASGNERLQNNIDRAMQGVGYLAAIVVDPIIGSAYIGIDTVFGTISYYNDLKRENISNSIERRLAGRRANIATGSVYYD